MIIAAEKERFSEICQRTVNAIHERSGIGTYKEKILHLVLKRFFCDDERCHEVKNGRFISDASTDSQIFEIQTRGLYPLKKKLVSYLEDTNKKVTVVCPLVPKKSLIWIDPESGDMSAPKNVTVSKPKNTLLRELMWIGELLDFSRVELKVVYVETDEYRLRDGYGTDKKIKATKVDRIPREIVDIVTLDSKEAFAEFFVPGKLPAEFRAKDFERATGLRKKGVSAGLRALESMGIITREKQSEHKVVYRIL